MPVITGSYRIIFRSKGENIYRLFFLLIIKPKLPSGFKGNVFCIIRHLCLKSVLIDYSKAYAVSGKKIFFSVENLIRLPLEIHHVYTVGPCTHGIFISVAVGFGASAASDGFRHIRRFHGSHHPVIFAYIDYRL